MKKLFVLPILALAAGGYAQVQMTSVLDTAVGIGGNVSAATYTIADNKYLATSGTVINIHNGDTGAIEGQLDISTVSPAPGGLGFFALTAGSDGSIFAYENGENDATHKLYQWDNIADNTATEAASGIAFARLGYVIGTGNDTKVVLTGSGNSGPIYIYGTSDDVTYTVVDTVTSSVAVSKSAMAVSKDLTRTWAVGDTGTASTIKKAVKIGGTWTSDPSFVINTALNPPGMIAYDDANNIVFAFKGTTIHALHGNTGGSLGTLTVTNGVNATPGYSGTYVDSVPGSGTAWFAGRGTTATNAVLQKITYTVPTAAQDWSIYE